MSAGKSNKPLFYPRQPLSAPVAFAIIRPLAEQCTLFKLLQSEAKVRKVRKRRLTKQAKRFILFLLRGRQNDRSETQYQTKFFKN
ncbi:hypothetical protein J2X54_000001 [Duganella sp. 3397]|uniref:hypothetical protein n=1 Tax=Duganella sp. 3397 TaxID=2817732 RepID=UPI00285ABB48|nr:hypothetical protein [Duganella sp. 3397]MDR7047566.1 hypothetical protein [Duganella sp. 3397]